MEFQSPGNWTFTFYDLVNKRQTVVNLFRYQWIMPDGAVFIGLQLNAEMSGEPGLCCESGAIQMY